MSPTDHIPTSFSSLEIAALPPQERKILSILSERVIMHMGINHAYERIGRLISENQVRSEPRHAVLIGAAGCGKSTLLDIMAETLPPRQDTLQLGLQSNQTILVVSLPGKITPRTMAIKMLRALGDQSALNGTCMELTERLQYYLRACGVEVIFIDEFQHLLALGRSAQRGTNKQLLESRNWIKSVIVATNVTFVLMGTIETLGLIDSEPQMERRFTELLTLEPFAPPADDNGMVSFTDALLEAAASEIDRFTNAEFFSDAPQDAERLYVATTGVPSTIKDLVIRACLHACRTKSKTVKMDHFSVAFQELMQPRLDRERIRLQEEQRCSLVTALQGRVLNPFAAPQDEIRQLTARMRPWE